MTFPVFIVTLTRLRKKDLTETLSQFSKDPDKALLGKRKGDYFGQCYF